MPNMFRTKIESGVLKVWDTNGNGYLQVVNRLSARRLKSMDDTASDPLVDFANDLQANLDSGRFLLTLIGSDNTIYFTDSDIPVFEGGVTLHNVILSNPYLKNCSLEDVQIPYADDLVIHFSKLRDVKINTSESVYMMSCYVDDGIKLPEVKGSFKFCLNKQITDINTKS